MKLRILLLITIPSFLFSCNQADKVPDDRMANYLTPAKPDKEHIAELSLNNGAKWKTDESTRIHAFKLNSILDLFSKMGADDIDSYKLLADDLLEELNGLIADCKMKGPEHEALHTWLEPVLKEVSDLKKITSAEQGKEGAEKLANKFREFNEYFF